MDKATAEGHASGSQMPSLLRQRMLNRAATFAEGVRPSTPPKPRRRSSLLSNFSDTQHSFRSSTDSLLQPGRSNDMDALTTSDQTSYWHSTPIVLAIVPAIAALKYENGGDVATDMILIALAGWFMLKCVVVPWEWYHDAQQRQYLADGEPAFNDTIHEEDEDGYESSEARPDSATSLPEEPKKADNAETPPLKDKTQAARAELRRAERMAFAACFLGPLLAAYLVHHVRSQLTRMRGKGIFNDLNLAIFILVAEMRPVSRLVRMQKERTLHLQRIVRADALERPQSAGADELAQRLAELEARFDGPMYNSNVDIMKVSAEVRQSMQHQLDALNRAVRKYEKRHMAQSIQIEARFQEIDVRLKDTLSLAAAAARTGQKPGIIAMTLSWTVSLLAYCLQVAWDIALYPYRTASALVAVVRSWVLKDGRQPRKRAKGPTNGYSPLPSTPRMQSKSGR
ncbi:hypothetical protein FB567DRAFT_470509 [Paraphoma chrysanthemicola]|uniref:Uncharacterized protein n=1 Tax=Paraphoma chrysanthemicola TaxID=798071 RepID=A0A8K0R936_9PLEO|nr:hypothetical protein FB567DRAFT_470509 [Paraphoma chrysanthemicola]